MKPNPGDVLVIRHPYIEHKHVVVRVVHAFSVMAEVEQFTRFDLWGEPVRRKLGGLILRNFGPGLTDEQVAFLRDRVLEIDKDYEDAVRRAGEAQAASFANFKQGERP